MFDREERVRRRAYEIWEREGSPHGRHDAHWMQALTEIVDEDMAAGRLTTDALDVATAPRPARSRRKAAAPGAPEQAGTRRTRQAATWSPADIKPGRGGRTRGEPGTD